MYQPHEKGCAQQQHDHNRDPVSISYFDVVLPLDHILGALFWRLKQSVADIIEHEFSVY